jgi:hypothetical protein
MEMLIQLANDSYLVSEETAQRVQETLPADRYTVTPVRDEPPPHPQLTKQQPSVFEQASKKHHPLTDRQKDLAQRMSKHLAKSQQPPQSKRKS